MLRYENVERRARTLRLPQAGQLLSQIHSQFIGFKTICICSCVDQCTAVWCTHHYGPLVSRTASCLFALTIIIIIMIIIINKKLLVLIAFIYSLSVVKHFGSSHFGNVYGEFNHTLILSVNTLCKRMHSNRKFSVEKHDRWKPLWVVNLNQRSDSWLCVGVCVWVPDSLHTLFLRMAFLLANLCLFSRACCCT